MRQANTDPWTGPRATASDTDPGSAPATMVDGADTSVTRELASTPVRRAGSGTDPGIGKPRAALADTPVGSAGAMDAARTWEEDTVSNTCDDARTDGGLALEARLRRLGGRAPQFAHFQPDSAGRYAASYAAVAKPVKSRAVSHTDPFGIIVAPDTSPPAQATRAATEPILAAAAVASPALEAAKPAAGSAASPPLARSLWNAADATKQGRVASSPPATMTVPGSRAKKQSRSRVLYGSLLLVALAVSALAFVVIGRGSSSTSSTSPTSASPGRSAAVPATASAATAAVVETSKPPLPFASGLAPAVAPTHSAQARVLPSGTNGPPPSLTKREVPLPRSSSGSPTSPQPTAPAPRSEDTKRIFE